MITSDFFDTSHGGVESHIFGLATAWKERFPDDEIIVVRTAKRPLLSDYEASEDDIDYRVLPSARAPRRRVGQFVKLPTKLALLLEFARRILRGILSARRVEEFEAIVGPVDCIHQHDFIESWGLTKRLAKRGHKIVWTNHLGEFIYLNSHPLGKRLLIWMTGHFSAAFAPSRELADQQSISPEVRYLPNGVDTDLFRPCRTAEELESTRRDLGWPEDCPVVIVPRRWAPTKGVVYAASALREAEWPKSHVVFAGSGTSEYPGYREEIVAQMRGAAASIEIHERLNRVTMAKMLRCAQVCLIPSLKEATSLSALEAMASGSVVVAADVGGLPEIVVDGVSGFLHEPASPSSIAGAVQRALASERSELAGRARRNVEENYSWLEVARSVRQAYREVLG